MIATGRHKAGRRPWIGVNSVEDDGRLKVLRVTAEGPADEAGLRRRRPHPRGRRARGAATSTDFYRKLWAAGEPGVEVALTCCRADDVQGTEVRSMDRLDFLRRKPTI